MKLLATTHLKLTEDINIGFTLPKVGQIFANNGFVHPKQPIQDIFEYIVFHKSQDSYRVIGDCDATLTRGFVSEGRCTVGNNDR